VKRVLVLRHAKSDWGEPGLADHDRPLAPRGHRGAELLAAHLRAERTAPDLVLCSTALRARETLELVRPALPQGTEVFFERRLYGAGVPELVDRLQELTPDVGAVLVVGHNPGCQDLVLDLAGAGDPALLARVEAKFPTAALATLDLAVDGWTDVASGTGTLVGLVTPRELE